MESDSLCHITSTLMVVQHTSDKINENTTRALLLAGWMSTPRLPMFVTFPLSFVTVTSGELLVRLMVTVTC